MRPTSATLARISRAAGDPLVRAALWFVAALVAMTIFFASNGIVLAALLVGAVAVYGVVSFRENESLRDLRAPLPDVWNSLIDALRENGEEIGEPTWHGAIEGRVSAGKLRIVVERHAGNFTRVRVRVGRFATEVNGRRAEAILASLAKRLA